MKTDAISKIFAVPAISPSEIDKNLEANRLANRIRAMLTKDKALEHIDTLFKAYLYDTNPKNQDELESATGTFFWILRPLVTVVFEKKNLDVVTYFSGFDMKHEKEITDSISFHHLESIQRFFHCYVSSEDEIIMMDSPKERGEVTNIYFSLADYFAKILLKQTAK